MAHNGTSVRQHVFAALCPHFPKTLGERHQCVCVEPAEPIEPSAHTAGFSRQAEAELCPSKGGAQGSQRAFNALTL